MLEYNMDEEFWIKPVSGHHLHTDLHHSLSRIASPTGMFLEGWRKPGDHRGIGEHVQTTNDFTGFHQPSIWAQDQTCEHGAVRWQHACKTLILLHDPGHARYVIFKHK